MHHSKFEDLDQGLKGETSVNKLENDFDIFSQFTMIKSKFHSISYAPCLELQVLIKEMIDYNIPSQKQWQEVERLGKSKYRLY